MSYSNPHNKTIGQLYDELEKVYNDYPEYNEQMPIIKMIELFASDDFYKLHLVAIEYLKQDKDIFTK
jgi:hypothetical protein